MPLRIKRLLALMMISLLAVAAWAQDEAGGGDAAGASLAAETDPARITPEEEEILALREELGAQIEAGEITLDEAIEIMEGRAEELGLDELYEDRDDSVGGGFDDDINRLLRDFQIELDRQIKSGRLSEEEAQAQLIDFMIELGLIMTVDDRPTEPARPPELPKVDIDVALELFEELMVFLAINEAFTREQVGEQVVAFHEHLVKGDPFFYEPKGVTDSQAELVYMTRDVVIWFDPDAVGLDQFVEEAQHRLLYVAMDLGIIKDDGRRHEPLPSPYADELRDFQIELDRQIKSGRLSEEEAEAQLIDFMIELGLIMTADGRPTEPARPPELPEVDIDVALELFEELMVFLAINEAFTREQVGEQVVAFHEHLVNGDPFVYEPKGVTDSQAELVYMTRDVVIWFDPDAVGLDQFVEEAQHRLLYVAMDLGIIKDDGRRHEPLPSPYEDELRDFQIELDRQIKSGRLSEEEAERIWQEHLEDLLEGEVVILIPDPNLGHRPEVERLLALREDLDRQVAKGRLTPEEAKERYYAAADELGLVDADGTIVILPRDGGRPHLPPDYEISPEEEEMMALLKELSLLIEQGELTPEEAWDRLTARAEELGWDRPTDLQGGPVSGGASGSEEPAPVDADGREFFSLRNVLASRVAADGLSSEEAFTALTTAVNESADSGLADDTAIEEASWGSIKAAMGR